MALTYTYSTGKITRDFHLKKAEGICQRDSNKNVLIGIMCRTCPYYGGELDWWGRNFDWHERLVKCTFHPEDDPGLSEIINEMLEKFSEEAITHYYD